MDDRIGDARQAVEDELAWLAHQVDELEAHAAADTDVGEKYGETIKHISHETARLGGKFLALSSAALMVAERLVPSPEPDRARATVRLLRDEAIRAEMRAGEHRDDNDE